MNETAYVSALRQKLETALHPIRLDLHDESALHAGHAGHRPGGNTHFRLEIVSNAFEGLSRIARHRLIHGVLAQEMQEQIHALTIKALTEAEAEKP